MSMSHWFLLNAPEDEDGHALVERFQRYFHYLESIRNVLPTAAYDFATAVWHYDHEDPQCPHDNWIEEVRIREIASGTRKEIRTIEIGIRLLGAFQNGHRDIIYKNVFNYRIEQKTFHEYFDAHGDWLIDEITLSSHNRILHEIVCTSARISIECEDILSTWIPFQENS